MFCEHRADDWDSYKMDSRDPHRELEPPEQEVAVVDAALATLQRAGVLPHTHYDHARMLACREAVRQHFEIPWTAITPRMQRLMYAINAIAQPRVMIAAGVFCGNTFIANAGAAVGPGACYEAEDLVGVEIDVDKAAQAEANVRRIDPTGVARIVAGDAFEVLAEYPGRIRLLYLDVDGPRGVGKGIYLDMLKTAYEKLAPGALVLAHNSVNCAERLQQYFAFVRDEANLRVSVNVAIDGEGLEVSMR